MATVNQKLLQLRAQQKTPPHTSTYSIEELDPQPDNKYENKQEKLALNKPKINVFIL